MRETDPNIQRYKELLKLKRRLLDQMKKHRKALAKNRAEKKRINEEITRLRKSGYAFAGMSSDAARARVGDEIRSVKPEDIYPRDLEKQFDKLERTTVVKYRKGSVDLDDIEDDGVGVRSKNDDGGSVYIGRDSGVIDLGDGDNDGDSDNEEPLDTDAE